MLLMATCNIAKADGEYPYLTFESSDGSVVSIAVIKNSNTAVTTSESLSLELKVSDGTLVATNDEGKKIFTLKDLTKMYFTDSDKTSESTSISSIEDENEMFELYTLTGISLGKFKDLDNAKTQLIPGVYIIKNNNHEMKISIK